MITLYDPFEGMQFGPGRCFLTGQPVGPADTIPVFAGWLQATYGLAERPLYLLDQSQTTYAALRLPLAPALRPRLDALEAEIQEASQGGPAALRALPPARLWQWLAKMFYGIFVTELLQQQAPLIKPQYPLAENAQLVQRFRAFFQLLQGLRVPTDYADFVPGSVFVLEADDAYDAPAFELDDDLNTLVFSVKLGQAVIVATLVDIGLISQAMRQVAADAQRPLHPAQIAEFKARAYYAAYLLAVVPDIYLRRPTPADAPGAELVLDALVDDVTSAIFNPWDNLGYGHTLTGLWPRWGLTEAQILANPFQPLSLLYDAAGQPQSAAEAAEQLAVRTYQPKAHR
ncbi:hypothetical protein GKZ68_16290 [Hymenobacter sp. BRD128]|uniref:hypothetical protein n=1 Tax=Hymenobacter sp. BRD128 TaxID=2675878 RepID=UPI001563640A|nr:hypothetical protein [Hymenobacter sp. BRD128]QKG58042.1 hypothetical protein GKZ68_16290 [Hymenobacter sp. BRD128]